MKPDCGTTNYEPVALPGGRLRRAGRRGERGQAVTEFAMVLPLFAILVTVVILFGKALYAYIQLTHTANEGARLAAVNQPQSGTLCSFLSSEGALPKGVTITVSYPDTSSTTPRAVGEPVTITASTSASGIPFIGVPTLTSSATMRIEQDTSANTTLNTTPCSA